MNVDIGLDHDHPFRPYVACHRGQDHLPRLAGEARHHRDHDVEGYAGRGPHRYALDAGKLRLEGLEERGFERDLLEDMVFGDRLAGQQALEDGVAAVRDGGDARHRLERGRRVVAGIFAERPLHDGLVHVDLELDHHLGGGRDLEIASLGTGQLHRRPAQASGHFPVVGRIRNLDLARIGQNRIDPDHESGAGLPPQALAFCEILAEAMVGLGRERERVLAQDQEPIMADVRNTGFRVLRDHDAGRDIGSAVLGAVGRDRKPRDVDGRAFDQHLVTGRRRGRNARRDRTIQSGQHLLQNGLLVRLEREQRLAARRIDAGDQRKGGSVVVEHDAGALPPVALLHGLADVAQCHRPVDVEQFAVLAQDIQELAKVLIRHCDLRFGTLAPADDTNAVTKKAGLRPVPPAARG